MIELTCPHCGHQLRIQSKYAGREGKCKHCQGPILVPSTASLAVPSEDLPGATSPPPPMPGGVGSTALDDLNVDANWQPPARVAGVEATPQETHSRVGCWYWLLVVFFTPGALIWGILLPKGHPQRTAAIVIPILIMVLVPVAALAIFGAGLLALNQVTTIESDAGDLAITPSNLQIEVSRSDYSKLQANNPAGQENAVTWRSSDPEIAKVVGNAQSAIVYGMAPGTATIAAEGIMSGEQATATVTVVPAQSTGDSAAEDSGESGVTTTVEFVSTGLPSYPGMEFETAPHADNAMYPSLGVSDPSALKTFKGLTSDDYETVSTHFYEHLKVQGWAILNSGYGDPNKQEFYMFAQRGNERLGYATGAENGRVAVYMTLAQTPSAAAEQSTPDATAVTPARPAAGQNTEAVPIDRFPLYAGLQFTPTDTPPNFNDVHGAPPDYVALYQGTVAADYREVSAFYKKRLDETPWDRTVFTKMDGPDHFFIVSGKGDGARFAIEGTPTANGGTLLRLGFYH